MGYVFKQTKHTIKVGAIENLPEQKGFPITVK